jgi:serine/threonine-protein kinase RsbW
MDKPIISGDTIKIPSSLGHLVDVDLFIETALRDYGTPETLIPDIAISVSELVNNAVMHGNRQARDKMVTVRISRENNTVLIAVTDQGTGFDPSEIQSPIDNENLLKAVGRGIFIVRSLMDTVDIVPGPNGTTITIGKAIA